MLTRRAYMTRRVRLVSDWRAKREPGTFRRAVQDLDELVSKIVRKKFGPLCFTCKKRRATENGHLFSRRIMATRFDIHPGGNCQPSCSTCNRAHQRDKNPYIFAFIEAFGSDAFAALRDRAFSNLKFSRLELERMYRSWKPSCK